MEPCPTCPLPYEDWSKAVNITTEEQVTHGVMNMISVYNRLTFFPTVPIKFSQLIKSIHFCTPHPFTYEPIWNLFQCCRDISEMGKESGPSCMKKLLAKRKTHHLSITTPPPQNFVEQHKSNAGALAEITSLFLLLWFSAALFGLELFYI